MPSVRWKTGIVAPAIRRRLKRRHGRFCRGRQVRPAALETSRHGSFRSRGLCWGTGLAPRAFMPIRIVSTLVALLGIASASPAIGQTRFQPSPVQVAEPTAVSLCASARGRVRQEAVCPAYSRSVGLRDLRVCSRPSGGVKVRAFGCRSYEIEAGRVVAPSPCSSRGLSQAFGPPAASQACPSIEFTTD